MKITRQCMLTGMLVLIATLVMVTPVSADPYLGGDRLVTDNGTYGTVSGGLWFDAYGAFEYAYENPITKTFVLPCDPEDVEWARLYVSSYIGNMQANYPLNTTVEFNGGGGYGTLGIEIMDTNYVYPISAANGTGTIWFNGHFNRVTSDCLMWYDVKDEINSSSVTARVQTTHPNGGQPFDGRVKMIALVVAYNDDDSDQIHYWVNQGHDTDSAVADTAGQFYIGDTDFDTTVVTNPGEASLTAIYLGSYNANYEFNNIVLPWANPLIGTYLGAQSWDVTNYLTGGDSVMKFDRNTTTGGPYSGYFKIPLALLTVEDREFIYDFSDDTHGTAGDTLLAYEGGVGAQLPGTTNVPTTAITSYTNIEADDELSEVTEDVEGYAAHRFEFTIDQSAEDVEKLTATWVGRGSGSLEDGARFYIWDDTSEEYELLDETFSAAETTLSGVITTEVSDYIDNGTVILLVVQNDNEDSTLETNYVKLAVVREV